MRGLFSFQRHPQGEGIGGRVLVTVVVWLQGAVAALTLVRWVLLRERGTQPGTLEYNFGHIGIRRLRTQGRQS